MSKVTELINDRAEIQASTEWLSAHALFTAAQTSDEVSLCLAMAHLLASFRFIPSGFL